MLLLTCIVTQTLGAYGATSAQAPDLLRPVLTDILLASDMTAFMQPADSKAGRQQRAFDVFPSSGNGLVVRAKV